MDFADDMDALMRKYSSDRNERDLIEHYSELYACLKTLEKLERAYSRGVFSSAASKAEYEGECKSLIAQARSNHQVLAHAFPAPSAFADAYSMSCHRALIRLQRGMPATLEHADGGAGPAAFRSARDVAEATEAIISLLDQLKLQQPGTVVELDVINDPVHHCLDCLRTVGYLVPALAGRDRLVAWSARLAGMRATDVLEDADWRQLLLDTESLYREFKVKVYETPEELWEAVQRRGGDAAPAAPAPAAPAPAWYSSAVSYWDAQAPTDDGVLGGYGFVSDVDVRDSRAFLKKAFGPALAAAEAGHRSLAALDCGAGVGRVSEQLLLHHFQEVDLVEPSAHLLEAARQRLGGPGPKPFPASHRAVGFFQAGIEGFDPAPGRYDVVWVQWAMLYLTDDDAVAFLRRCAAALRPGGLIFIKENVCAQGFIVDSEDASVTRSHAYCLELFTKRAGLRLSHTALQKDFPAQLFKVRMYALKPPAP